MAERIKIVAPYESGDAVDYQNGTWAAYDNKNLDPLFQVNRMDILKAGVPLGDEGAIRKYIAEHAEQVVAVRERNKNQQQ